MGPCLCYNVIIILQLLNGKFSYLNGRLATEVRLNQLGRDKYHLARQSFYPQGYGIALREGAPYKAAFEKTLVSKLL